MSEKTCKYCAMQIPEKASVCPYCRKKVPLQITIKTSNPERPMDILKDYSGLLIVIFLCLFALFYFQLREPESKNIESQEENTSSASTPTSHRPKTPSTGESGILHCGMEYVPMAVTEEAFKAWIRADVAGDRQGKVALFESRQIFFANENARALVIERGVLKSRVRIQSGMAEGSAGWVPNEWIQPL